MEYPRIVVRKSTYRDKAGYTVTKYTAPGQSQRYQPSVFVETRSAAELCRYRFLADEEISLADMTFTGERGNQDKPFGRMDKDEIARTFATMRAATFS